VGVFRLCLAFCVILAHGLNVRIPAATADVAVQTFYIVSGFYMGLILTEKYSRFSQFFVSRLLRLYPAYLAVVAATLAHSVARIAVGRSAADPGLLQWMSGFMLTPLAKLYLVVTNLLLWGQDVALFLKFSPLTHALAFTTNFTVSDPEVQKYLLVPQAWSLSIELGFYLLAPWLVGRSTKTLVALFAATLASRLALASIGLWADPWNYRFFPNEVGLFILGILIFRSMKSRTGSIWTERIALAGLIIGAATLSAIPGDVFRRMLFYGYCCWALPLVFRLTRHSRVDRYIGELSYPVYLSHVLIISLALYAHATGWIFRALIVGMVFAASVLLHELVQKPVDRYRAARLARTSPARDAAASPGRLAVSR
jgi:peptidoglycan/LPS O-acetylase OafA/YrhL